jgi:hypothetical protein
MKHMSHIIYNSVKLNILKSQKENVWNCFLFLFSLMFLENKEFIRAEKSNVPKTIITVMRWAGCS